MNNYFRCFILLILSTLFFFQSLSHAADEVPANRVASIFIAEDFLNEQLKKYVKSDLIKTLQINLDPENGHIFLRGLIQVPIEELRAVNLDPSLGSFRFQASIKLSTTTMGHLILEFPLAETFFYPASSKNPEHDKVIVPVQMLSLALASARGYLAALSGDFSGFERRSKKLSALLHGLDHAITHETNPDLVEQLKDQREATRLQLAAVPIERKQLEGVAKELSHIMGFTGEKELNLNEDLGAMKNALILKVKLSQLIPYLQGVELGGVRVRHNHKDGSGENYLAIDVNSTLANEAHAIPARAPMQREPMKIPPSLIIRLNQSLFESSLIVEQEKKSMSSKIRDFKLELKDDGLHVTGKYHSFLFSIPFETVVDFLSTDVDVFEVRIRALQVGGIDFSFLEKTVLESMQRRLDEMLKGVCHFEYVGMVNDKSHALRVTVNSKALLPIDEDLHLIKVDVLDSEFLMKIGRK